MKSLKLITLIVLLSYFSVANSQTNSRERNPYEIAAMCVPLMGLKEEAIGKNTQEGKIYGKLGLYFMGRLQYGLQNNHISTEKAGSVVSGTLDQIRVRGGNSEMIRGVTDNCLEVAKRIGVIDSIPQSSQSPPQSQPPRPPANNSPQTQSPQPQTNTPKTQFNTTFLQDLLSNRWADSAAECKTKNYSYTAYDKIYGSYSVGSSGIPQRSSSPPLVEFQVVSSNQVNIFIGSGEKASEGLFRTVIYLQITRQSDGNIRQSRRGTNFLDNNNQFLTRDVQLKTDAFTKTLYKC